MTNRSGRTNLVGVRGLLKAKKAKENIRCPPNIPRNLKLKNK
jgi:hypothetical protein